MMLVKFISFYFCSLIGINKVVAQLDAGTYKIINRASQSSLCSNDAEEPIYVSTQEYSCAQELWVLKPSGGEDGLYIVKNFGSNSFAAANKTLGSIVVSNDVTSFAVSSAGSNGYMIRLPNSDLVWTVGPTMIPHNDIFLQPANGDDTQLWAFISIDDTIGHNPFIVQVRRSQEDKHANLTVVEDDITWTHNVLALGSMWSALVYTHIDIVVAGQFNGHGSAWGFGAGYVALSGTLSFNDEDTLFSAENDFVILGAAIGGGATRIKFTINDQTVAVMTLASVGLDVAGGDGTFTWTKD